MTALGAPGEKAEDKKPVQVIDSLPMFVAVHSSPMAAVAPPPSLAKPVVKAHESTGCMLTRILLFVTLLSALLATCLFSLHYFDAFPSTRRETIIVGQAPIGFVAPQFMAQPLAQQAQAVPQQQQQPQADFTDITKVVDGERTVTAVTPRQVDGEVEEMDKLPMRATVRFPSFGDAPRPQDSGAISAPPTPVVVRTPPSADNTWEEYERRRVAYENQMLVWRVHRLQQMLAMMNYQQQQREATLSFAILAQHAQLQQAAAQIAAYRRQAEIQEYWRQVAETRPHDAPAEQIIAHMRGAQQLQQQPQPEAAMLMQPQPDAQQQQQMMIPQEQPLQFVLIPQEQQQQAQPQMQLMHPPQPLLAFPHHQQAAAAPLQPLQEVSGEQVDSPDADVEVVTSTTTTTEQPAAAAAAASSSSSASEEDSDEAEEQQPRGGEPLPAIHDRIYQKNFEIAQRMMAKELQPQIFTSIPRDAAAAAPQQPAASTGAQPAASVAAASAETQNIEGEAVLKEGSVQTAVLQQQQPAAEDTDAIYRRLQQKSMDMQAAAEANAGGPVLRA